MGLFATLELLVRQAMVEDDEDDEASSLLKRVKVGATVIVPHRGSLVEGKITNPVFPTQISGGSARWTASFPGIGADGGACVLTKSANGWTRHLKDRPRADPPDNVLADLAAARAEENAARRANDGPREVRAAVAYSDRFMRWLYEEINERGINLNFTEHHPNQWNGVMNGISGFFSTQIQDVARDLSDLLVLMSGLPLPRNSMDSSDQLMVRLRQQKAHIKFKRKGGSYYSDIESLKLSSESIDLLVELGLEIPPPPRRSARAPKKPKTDVVERPSNRKLKSVDVHMLAIIKANMARE